MFMSCWFMFHASSAFINRLSAFLLSSLGGFICNACIIQQPTTGPFIKSLDVVLLLVSSEYIQSRSLDSNLILASHWQGKQGRILKLDREPVSHVPVFMANRSLHGSASSFISNPPPPPARPPAQQCVAPYHSPPATWSQAPPTSPPSVSPPPHPAVPPI